MNHRAVLTVTKPFNRVKDDEKRALLKKRAKKKWRSLNWKERTKMRKGITNYGMAAL